MDWMFHCYTDDLPRRIAEHQSGFFTGHIYKRRPVELVWSDAFQTRDDAKAAERRIKGWSQAKKEALIAGDWDRISELATGRSMAEKRPSASSGLR